MSRPPLSTPAIVTGLVAEADCIRHALRRWPEESAPPIFSSGGVPARARKGARRLIAEGAAGLISFGIAGGLDPALRPGDIVVASAVILPDGSRIPADPGWRTRFIAGAGGASGAGAFTVAPVAGADTPLASAAAKNTLLRTTGAVAVDMESHAVAAIAAACAIPFLVLRAVADPADRAVPVCALAGLGADGRTRALPVLGGLMLRPWEVFALIRLARESAAALAALRRVSELGLSALLAL